MPDFFSSAPSPLDCSQKNPSDTISAASALRSLRSAMSASCLRKASKLGSLIGADRLTATCLYGLGGAGSWICCCAMAAPHNSDPASTSVATIGRIARDGMTFPLRGIWGVSLHQRWKRLPVHCACRFSVRDGRAALRGGSARLLTLDLSE